MKVWMYYVMFLLFICIITVQIGTILKGKQVYKNIKINIPITERDEGKKTANVLFRIEDTNCYAKAVYEEYTERRRIHFEMPFKCYEKDVTSIQNKINKDGYLIATRLKAVGEQ